MNSKRVNENQVLKANLVVIGAGGAGLAAASAATEHGIGKVVILEKRNAPGGNTTFVSGIFAADSPAQKRALIDCRVEACFKIAMNFAHWRINPRIVRDYMDKSGDTIRWLENKGLDFTLVPFYHNQIPTWHVPKGQGVELVKVLSKECHRLGIKLLVNTAARKILKGPGGEVIGVLATGKNGDITIKTGSVIIATGGYAGNKALLKKYSVDYSENTDCVGMPHSGDGLTMAIEAGAATEGLGLTAIAGPQVPGFISLKIGVPPDVQEVPLMAIALEPTTVWVNKRGERFADESAGAHHFMLSNAINRQPGSICFTLLDTSIVQEQIANGLFIGMGQAKEIAEQRSRMPGLTGELENLRANGIVKRANSWDVIAKWIGADPGKLCSEIQQYNTACDKMCDPFLGKDPKYMRPLRTPPFYAIRCNLGILDTMGGIKINEHMEVLNMQGNTMKGLFAAGVIAGGWESDTYCDVLSGHTSGFAINSGRIAGENAAKYISENK